MHTTTGKNSTIHHNGDYSGDVKIVVRGGDVLPFTATDGEQYCEVTILFEDIRKLVFEYLRDRHIAKVENMTDEQLLEYFAV